MDCSITSKYSKKRNFLLERYHKRLLIGRNIFFLKKRIDLLLFQGLFQKKAATIFKTRLNLKEKTYAKMKLGSLVGGTVSLPAGPGQSCNQEIITKFK